MSEASVKLASNNTQPSKFDPEDELFHGKLAYIRDLVLFEGEDAKGLALNALVTEALTDHLNRQEK